MSISLIPDVFSESQSYVELSSHEITMPEAATGTEKLVVSGLIDGYDRGKFINLELISPSGVLDTFSTFGSEDGEFYTIIEIDRDYEIGEYHLSVEYRGQLISTNFIVL